MTKVDTGAIDRAMRLRRMMNEFLVDRTPQERDRMMQIHLAQARGPKRNAQLLCEMMNATLRRRAARVSSEKSDG